MRHIALLATIAVSLTQTVPAFAVGSAGFENASLSTRSLARGNASVADSDTADSVAFNPAGLTELDDNQIYLGATPISLAGHYEGAEGRSDEDASRTVVPVPYFYTAYRTPLDKLSIGIGANSPFGLITKYNSTGNFRHIAYFNELKTSAYHLSLAYEVTPQLSVGGGWTYMDIALKQVGKFNSLFLTGDAQDAPFEYDVDGHGEGWNLGLLLQLTENDKIGVFYRNEVRTHLRGKMSTHDLTGTIAAVFGGPTNVTSADTDISLPANVTIGYERNVNSNWELEFDFGWTAWSSYDSFDTAFGTSNAVLAGFEHLNRDYLDAISLHAGSSYKINETWTLNNGYFYYQQAANKNTYTNENPDGNRHGVSVGFEHQFKQWTLDFMYMGIFVLPEEIENTAGNPNGTDIDGTYSTFIQLMSVGLSYKF